MSSASERFGRTARSRFGNRMLPNIDWGNMKTLFAQMGAYFGLGQLAELTTGHNVQPGVMLGWLPLYAVEEFEVAKSDKQLRFRSIGGQFFAFQEGDNLALRIRLRLNGTMRFVWLSILDYLYLNGLGTYEVRNLIPADRFTEFDFADLNAGTVWNSLPDPGLSGSTNYVPLLSGGKNMYQVSKAEQINFGGDIVQVGKNEWKQENVTGRGVRQSLHLKDRGVEEVESTTPWKEIPHWQKRERILKHKTFNVISEEEVFIKMYIETMIWSKTVGRDGREEITVNLLLRRYVEPPDRIYIDTVEHKWKQRKNKVTRSNLDSTDGYFLTEDELAKQEAQKLEVKTFRRNTKTGDRRGFTDDEWRVVRRNKKGDWTDEFNVEDRNAAIRNKLEASPEEVEESLYRDVEDEWYDEEVKHRYVGTLPDDRIAGEFGMLAVNTLWRMGWFGRKTFIGGFHGSRLSSDPMVGRLALIFNTINTTKNNDTFVQGSVESASKSLAYIPDNEATRIAMENTITEQFGLSGEIDDVFVVPGRQEIFNEILMKGYTRYKLSGTFQMDSTLEFDVPAKISIWNDLHTDPYTEGLEPRFMIEGFNIAINKGATYYLGSGGKVEWVERPGRTFHVNKRVLDEMYLYVENIQFYKNEITFIAYIIHPRYGL